MWGSKDVEVENGAHPYVKPEVRVEAQDTQTKQNIEKELMQELKNRNGTRYTYDTEMFDSEIFRFQFFWIVVLYCVTICLFAQGGIEWMAYVSFVFTHNICSFFRFRREDFFFV